MHRHEFDAWITNHYSQLLRVAARRVNDPEAAAEVVHAIVANALNTQSYLTVEHPWTFYVNAIRGFAQVARRSDDRRRALARAYAPVARAGFSHGRRRPAPQAE